MYLLYESGEYKQLVDILDDLTQHQVKVVDGPRVYWNSRITGIPCIICFNNLYGRINIEATIGKDELLHIEPSIIRLYYINNDDYAELTKVNTFIIPYSYSGFKTTWRNLTKEVEEEMENSTFRFATSQDISKMKKEFDDFKMPLLTPDDYEE